MVSLHLDSAQVAPLVRVDLAEDHHLVGVVLVEVVLVEVALVEVALVGVALMEVALVGVALVEVPHLRFHHQEGV